MPVLASNAAIAFLNLFDDAVITTSSAASSTPASNLQVPHIATKWRGTGGTTEWILATFAADVTADTFMLRGFGSTFLPTGTAHIRASSSGAGPTGGDVYDSGVVAALVDPNYGYLIHARPAPLTFRTVRWDLVQTGAAYIEAGRGAITTRTQVNYNFVPGESRRWVPHDKVTESEAGQDYIDRASPGAHREWDGNFSLVDETQRWALWEAMDMANGIHRDILLMLDPTSTNMGRDSIWGRMKDIAAVIRPYTNADLYSRSLGIKERS